jgi:copper homeostasis protein
MRASWVRRQRGRQHLGILLEVCVDDPAGLVAAVAGGADRIELCAALALGGLTPSFGFMQAAAGCGVPCMAMIRPRAGDFVFDAPEVAAMRADVRAARAVGLAGVVIGASRPDGDLDEDMLAVLLAEADGMDVTLHRAIDLCPDPVAAVGVAIRLGIRRILSSGGAMTAPDGEPRLAAMMMRAGTDCTVMPGSGITAVTLPRLAHLPLREIHASCATVLQSDGRAAATGFHTAGAKRTDRAQVAALKTALAH